MERSFRNFLLSLFSFALLSGGAIVVFNLYVDPWRFIYDSEVASWDSKGRLQNPGILRQKVLSTIVLGTSMTQNFDPKEVEEHFGGESAILSISAGTGREQSLLASMAMREQQGLENILWGLHPGSFSLPSEEIKVGSFPLYLYDESRINDFLYLFNLSNTKKSLKDTVKGRSSNRAKNWKNLQAWSSRYQYGCPQALELQIKRRGLPSSADDWLGQSTHIYENVRDNLYAVVVANSDVNFSFFFPPFSSLYWSILAESQPRRYQAYRQVMTEVVNQLIEEPNVEIYDFTQAKILTENMANYRDLTHFSGDINSRLLMFMKEGKYRVNYDDRVAIGRSEDLAIYKDVGSHVLDCLSKTND